MAGRVLLTGATGLIGCQTVAPLVARGFEVFALSRSGAKIDQAYEIKANILDPEQLDAVFEVNNFTHLMHLAWHDDPADRWTAEENFAWSEATLALVRAFAKAGGQRAVCAGSCAEYEWGDRALNEASPLRQSSAYSRAKSDTGNQLMAEAPVLDVSLAWARIFFCYGPGEPKGRLLGDLIKGISSGDVVDCTDGLQERDFLHTGDIGRALAAILDSDVEGAVNVASGQATPVRDLIMEVATQMGHPELVNLGARARPEDDPPRVVADTEKLRQRTDFEPLFDIASGVAEVLKADLS